MFRPGETIRGYTVTGLLGEGGMGAVYAAVREADGVEVAVKVLHQARGENLIRARTEAQAQQMLDHPHVVRIFDVLDLDGVPGLVMERVRGPDLRAWLDAGRPSVADALTVFRGVLAGVEHAHQRGLIHRDLKPANVLLSVSEEGVVPKVADFGLAKLEDSARPATRSGMMLGTPGYMAPEQVRDAKRADRRADVYALGVMLYELICGQAPIRGTDVITAYEEMTNQSWQDPESLGASPEIAAAIRRALDPDPERRPPDAPMFRLMLDPRATFVDTGDGPSVLAVQTDGAARARALSAEGQSALVDPTRPALRTPIAAPEGGLVGRDDLVAEVAREVHTPGLVVLRGPPGVGKTALARAVGRLQGMRSEWTGGVWWVDLRGAPSAVERVEQALGVPRGGSVGHALARRGRALVVLDEAEGLREELEAAVSEWLGDAPGLTVLTTSRHVVGVAAGREILVEPLSETEGVALFVRRARTVRTAWMPSSDERRVIGKLVAQLDGLPLAIALAAARARLLAPRELLDRLERSLDVLRTRGKDPRASSLRGAIASSWDDLSPDQQRALGWLSVAVGDIPPAAAEALLEPIDPDPLLLLEELEEASWLAVTTENGTMRYRMLRSLAAFAAEALEEVEEAQRAHAEVWLARGDAAMARFEATGERVAAEQLADEVEDLIAIGKRFAGTADGFRASSLASRFLVARGDVQRSEAVARRALDSARAVGVGEARAWVELAEAQLQTRPEDASRSAGEALARADQPAIRIRAWVVRAGEAVSDVDAQELQQAIELARAEGSPRLEGDAWFALAGTLMRAGELGKAEASGEEALSLFRAAGHRAREAKALSILGLIRHKAESWEEAERTLDQAVALAGELGDGKAQAAALGRRSMVLARAGRRDEAVACLEEAVLLSRRLGDRVGEGFCELNLGATESEPARAAERFRAAAHLARRAGARHLLAMSERNLAVSEMLRGAPERAVEPLRRTREHHAERGESDVIRLGAWLAMALAGSGERQAARAELASLEGEGEDARILALARLVVDEAPADRVDATVEFLDDEPWDVRLTRNVALRLLGGA